MTSFKGLCAKKRHKDKTNSSAAKDYLIFFLLGFFIDCFLIATVTYIEYKVFFLNHESAIVLPVVLSLDIISLIFLFGLVALFKFNNYLRRVTLALIIALNAITIPISYLTNNTIFYDSWIVMWAKLISVVVLCIILKSFSKIT